MFKKEYECLHREKGREWLWKEDINIFSNSLDLEFSASIKANLGAVPSKGLRFPSFFLKPSTHLILILTFRLACSFSLRRSKELKICILKRCVSHAFGLLLTGQFLLNFIISLKLIIRDPYLSACNQRKLS